MPRYFFHVRDGKDVPDHDGTEIADPASVRPQAVSAAGEMLRDLGPKWDGQEWRMTVVDEAGKMILRLSFSATSGSDASEPAE